MYRLLRPLLFQLDPEASHHLTFKLLRLSHAARATSMLSCPVPALPTRIMGLDLANPVGLAAGLDKNADCVGPLADFGFGFVELGTVTPVAQVGNPPPRLFRLTSNRALINRLGFPNVGTQTFLKNLQTWNPRCPIGINIGKNKDTPNERALDDYLAALRAVYRYAHYVTVNISSPNTPGLRALQEGDYLENLLRGLQTERNTLVMTHEKRVPMALKIAPDLDDAQLGEIARLAMQHGIDAIIATNTTIARPGLESESLAQETGGLSGAPLKKLSTEVIRKLYAHVKGHIPIVGVGGIETADDAWEKLIAGADAVQIYTSFLYEGPGVIPKIVKGLAQRVAATGERTLPNALAKLRAGKI